MSVQTHVYKVDMACTGCSGAVEKAVKKVDGVQEVTTDIPSQKVTVTGTASYDDVKQAIVATGKQVHPELSADQIAS
ncbi:hypothetical protein IWQ60_000403 [Tieghemiomyces parasiticus]|uniref:HMA domain-containing protein n=1 Tax=Tieghemiomyces parasiticus TaxID=78921 RepID=A0A9W8A1C8_9FUNG|nr:hypothetical protein IWQ60_008478 [Tieghemiomyces parasiticus]KAJ1930291.1 hypothetical protein IWQ60_000403 [Tieghemiomyces parasiticus]